MEQSLVVGFITFLLGLILGHRLSLGRDRRKEFNDIAQPIREILLNERERPSPLFTGLCEIDADRLEGVLHWWQRRGFRRSLSNYKQEKKRAEMQEPIYGTVSYAATDEIIKRIERLLRYTKRR